MGFPRESRDDSYPGLLSMSVGFHKGVAKYGRDDSLRILSEKAKDCVECSLSLTRSNVVFGAGNITSPLVFVGEAPGAEEDRVGLPFVGRSGRLLDRLVSEELGLTRDQIYIANMVMCRPPANRNPTAAEIGACSHFLDEQLRLMDFSIIVALGSVATRHFVSPSSRISKVRGTVFETSFGTVMPMFHPSYALRTGETTMKAMRSDLVGAKAYIQQIGAWKW